MKNVTIETLSVQREEISDSGPTRTRTTFRNANGLVLGVSDLGSFPIEQIREAIRSATCIDVKIQDELILHIFDSLKTCTNWNYYPELVK